MAKKKKGTKVVAGEAVHGNGQAGEKAAAGCQSSGRAPTKQELKKLMQRGGRGSGGGGDSKSVGTGTGTRSSPQPSETLPAGERAFLEDCVTLKAPAHEDGADQHNTYKAKGGNNNRSSKGGNSGKKVAEAALVEQAKDMLEQFHMCVVQNVLSSADLDVIQKEFVGMLDFKGDSAIGEKDATKRSASRMYNCKCQVGPGCGWSGWQPGSEGTKETLHSSIRGLKVWERICAEFGFLHIKRVEVVTSHAGCRNQDWHVDAVHGLTVIFPLVDVDSRKGPTQIEFTTAFNSLHTDRGKIKRRDPAAPESCHAAMPAGSVLIFNANCSHRGTANISTASRPILVLDCSPECPQEPSSLWDL